MTRFRIADHGNEVVGGLAEAVAVAAFARPDKAAEYRPAFFRMIDRLLAVGRNEDGVFWHMLNTATGKPVDTRPVVCWGYMYNAVYTAYLLGGGERYRDTVKQAFRQREALIHAFVQRAEQRGPGRLDAAAPPEMVYVLQWKPPPLQ